MDGVFHQNVVLKRQKRLQFLIFTADGYLRTAQNAARAHRKCSIGVPLRTYGPIPAIARVGCKGAAKGFVVRTPNGKLRTRYGLHLFRQLGFFAGKTQRVRGTKAGKHHSVGTHHAHQTGHLARFGNAHLHQCGVGLRRKGQQRQGNPYLGIVGTRTAHHTQGGGQQLGSPFLDNGFAVGSHQSYHRMGPAASGFRGPFLKGFQGVGDAEEAHSLRNLGGHSVHQGRRTTVFKGLLQVQMTVATGGFQGHEQGVALREVLPRVNGQPAKRLPTPVAPVIRPVHWRVKR